MSRTGTPAPPASAARTSRAAGAPGEALLLAQAQSRRGLRAGPSTLVDAKTAYGEAQWSGEHDRRPEPGLLVRTRL